MKDCVMAGKSKQRLRWRDLTRQGKALRRRRPRDRFMRALIDGALAVGRDKDNPIRGNLFAAAMRELVTHLLHTLAPDGEVTACAWYAPEPKTNGPTRRQRASYICRAGLPDAFVADDLGLDIASVTKPLIATVDQLHKLTHLKPHSILADGKTIRILAAEVFDALEELFEAAAECRRAVVDELKEHIDRALFDSMISEAINNLDALSTHTTVEGHESEEIEVLEMNHELIAFAVSGSIYVELQYGSNSDLHNDMGAVMSDSFPYKATLEAKAADPSKPLAKSVKLTVDESSFYE